MSTIRFSSVLCIALTTLGLLVTACSRQPRDKSDFQGSWVPEQKSQKWINIGAGGPSCQIVFKPDGTFNAVVPDYLLWTFDQCSGRLVTGMGHWSVSPDLIETKLKLEFAFVDGKELDWTAKVLRVETRGKGFLLFFYPREIGSDRFTFERAPGQGRGKSR
jgi:hypothetical protein